MTEISRLRDTFAAEILDISNLVACNVPALAHKYGPTDSISNKPVRYRRLHASAADPAFGEWVRHDGIEGAGLTPPNYPDVAIMTFDKETMDDLARVYRARHAGAYVVGKSAIMVGTSDYIDIFGIDPQDEGRYALSMKIGRGLFQGLPGLLSPEGLFISANYADLQVMFLQREDMNPTIPGM